MNLLTVFVQNKPGQTARVTGILAEHKVNICWVTVASSGSFGVMKFLVDKLDVAQRALRDAGLTTSLVEVVALEVPNEPGGLRKVSEALGQHEINLDNCSGFISNHRAILIIETQERARALSILKSRGWQLLSQDDLLQASS